MKKYTIGDCISVIDNRNIDNLITNLVGININKQYIPSIANTFGTNLKNYKIINKNQFSCSLMQVSRDQHMPIALYSKETPSIISPAYTIFEICRANILLPEYLDLWFKRDEFDREASFYAVGGVRGSLDLNDFCNISIYIPSIEKQSKIVNIYTIIKNRINILSNINNILLSQCDKMYKNIVHGKDFNGKFGDIVKISPGKRLENAADGDIPLFGAGGILKYISQYNNNFPSLIIGKDGTLGKVRRRKKFWASEHTFVITSKYYEYAFNILKNIEYNALSRGSAQPLIKQKDIANVDIFIPQAKYIEEFERNASKIMLAYQRNIDEIHCLEKLALKIISNMDSEE